jgi:hypothetical protein
MKLKIEVKSSYGTERIYIRGKESGPISVLTGQKTVTRAQLAALVELGYELEYVLPEMPEFVINRKP